MADPNGSTSEPGSDSGDSKAMLAANFRAIENASIELQEGLCALINIADNMHGDIEPETVRSSVKLMSEQMLQNVYVIVAAVDHPEKFALSEDK